MKKLSRDQYIKARNYMVTQARSLEAALFAHNFMGASAGNTLKELAQFQTEDGGFGKALEPDMRSPSSSALATEIGLRTLVKLGASSDHPLVLSAVCFLLNALDPDTKTWRVVPLDVNEYPHAPWWHDESGSLAKTFDNFKIIPRAGILAVLYRYSDLLPKGWLADITKPTITDLFDVGVETFSGGGDALIYTRRLAETPELPQEIREKLIDRVRILANLVVTRDSAAWSQYSIPPLKLAPTPESITAATLADCIPAHLDYLVESQNPEGFWDVTWSWVDYHDDWQIAKTEWRGILTLEALMTLEAYERIENR